jgi:hypothetical protein
LAEFTSSDWVTLKAGTGRRIEIDDEEDDDEEEEDAA